MKSVIYFNPDKLSRARKTAGANASEFAVLIEYLKLAGLAQDENGVEIPYQSYKDLKEEDFEIKDVDVVTEKGEAVKKLKKKKK